MENKLAPTIIKSAVYGFLAAVVALVICSYLLFENNESANSIFFMILLFTFLNGVAAVFFAIGYYLVIKVFFKRQVEQLNIEQIMETVLPVFTVPLGVLITIIILSKFSGYHDY